MTIWIGVSVGALICGVVSFVSLPSVFADPIINKIEKEHKALERLKSEINTKRKQADEVGKKRESLLEGIQALDVRLLQYRKAHQDVTQKLLKKTQEINIINARLAELRDSVHKRQDAILARLRAQYMEGRFGHWKILLASNSYGDFQRRRQYLSVVSERDHALIGTYQVDMDHMQLIEQEREEARIGMLSYKQHTETQLAEVNSVKKEKKIYLATITRQKESYEHSLQELEHSASRIDSLLRELETRRRATIGRPSLGGIIPQGAKGVLPWPADGNVISFFGRQKHPTFNTYLQRRGIEIKTIDGSVIHAVMPGSVVYADWLKGYGLVIILDHANGMFSLYAHASKILAAVGTQVTARQAIGTTGDTGMTGESILYFELREGAEPLDPLQWLVRR